MKALMVINSELFDIYPLDDVSVIYTIQIKDSAFNFAHGIGNLKPMPQKKAKLKGRGKDHCEYSLLEQLEYRKGWNDCIDEILGDTE